ncbi:CFEM domain-containing protein [Chaetomium sp. MPI-CAGE-AT-0009]|nr:CFEM domain-containing protein [Chaetomium sp. MPI-CAGE-AT-0009]
MRAILGLVVGLLAAVVPLASAQGDTSAVLQALPKCAADCLIQNVLQSDCAKDPTPACICTNAPLQHEITLCVAANCTVKQTLVAKNATSTACGVPARDRALTYDATSIVLASISCSIVLLRVGFKLFVTRSLSPDDYVVALLVAFAIPSIIIIHVGLAPNGVGRDIWALTPDHITTFLFYFYLMAMLYFVQVMLVKVCMLLFYLRIFPSPTVRRLLWGTLIFNVLFGIIFFFVAIFQCAPVSYFWNGWDGEHEGKCLNKNAIAWANAAISIALDIWMLAIPLAQLKALNLHWKKKIGVGLMFVVGTFVTVVSIIRLQSLVTFAKSSNATWDNFPVSLWSTVEINVGIMCTCMPTLRLLLVRLFPALGGSTSRYGNRGGGAGGYYSGGGYGKSGRSNGGGGKSNNGGGGGGGGGDGGSGMQSGRRRPLGNLTSTGTSHGRDLSLDELDGDGGASTGVRPSTASVDSVAAAKPLGIVRHQTFAVQYDDDDETSLVEMRELEPEKGPGGRGHGARPSG